MGLVVEGRPVVLKPDLAEALEAAKGRRREEPVDASAAPLPGMPAAAAATPGKDRDAIQPQVLLFSNGDLSSFELALQREGSERTLTVAIVTGGKLELQDSDRKAGT